MGDRLIKPGKPHWAEAAHAADRDKAVNKTVRNQVWQHNNGRLLQPSGATMLNIAFLVGLGGAVGHGGVARIVGVGVGNHDDCRFIMVNPLDEA